MRHKLKIWPDQFEAIEDGRKTFEFRRDDRDPPFEVGDELSLAGWHPKWRIFTGASMVVYVTYIVRGPSFGIPRGYCLMSVQKTKPKVDKPPEKWSEEPPANW